MGCREVTVYDLINALGLTHEEVHLILDMSIGQCNIATISQSYSKDQSTLDCC